MRGTVPVRAMRWSLALTGLLIIGLVPIASAAPPTPSAGTAVVDGDPSEWSLTADRYADLTRGGIADREVVGGLFLRYDCESETLFGLVLLADGYGALVSRPENAYLRIGTTGKLVSGESGNDGTPPDFSWVDSDGELARGYEVSAPLAPGSYTLRSHILIPDDSEDGYATVDNVSRATPLEPVCEKPTPTPTPTPTATPTPTPTPDGSVAPTEGPGDPTATPEGSVAPATGRPRITLPPTDVAAVTASSDTPRPGLALVVLLLVGIGAGTVVVLPRRPRPVTVDDERAGPD